MTASIASVQRSVISKRVKDAGHMLIGYPFWISRATLTVSLLKCPYPAVSPPHTFAFPSALATESAHNGLPNQSVHDEFIISISEQSCCGQSARQALASKPQVQSPSTRSAGC